MTSGHPCVTSQAGVMSHHGPDVTGLTVETDEAIRLLQEAVGYSSVSPSQHLHVS